MLKETAKDYFSPPIVVFLCRVKSICSELLFLGTQVVYSPLAVVYCILGIKFPVFLISRVGHLCVEPDVYIKEKILDDSYANSKLGRDIILVKASTKISNPALLKYWGKYFNIIENNLASHLLFPLTNHPLTYVRTTDIVAERSTVKAPRVFKHWSNRAPLIQLSDEHRQAGKLRASLLGITANKWHVCIHSREGSSYPGSEYSQSHRSGDISDFFAVAETIVRMGGIPVRMGDPSMKLIDQRITGFIDYAHSPLKEDWLDLYLASTCKVFIGTASGAYSMAALFGVPVLVVNAAPLASVFPVADKRSIGIPQLYYSRKLGRFLTFREVLESPLANYRDNIQFESDQITLVKNSNQDINNGFLEIFHKLNGKFRYSDRDLELQLKFKALFKPGHYLYDSASEVSTLFLRKYPALLN